jgi:protein PhnA
MSDDIVRDSNGNQLSDGDSVTVIKDLKVKGTSETIKRGTLVKSIRLTGNPGEVECNTKQVKGLVLKTEFLKKA